MNSTIRFLSILAIVASTALAADETSIGATVNGIEIGDTAASATEPAQAESRSSCGNQCNAAHAKCGSEVRRARQECSRKAATGGRDPFDTRRSNDYTYFCDYFNNPFLGCGSDGNTRECQARFAQRYQMCVDRMYNNIASMRYECHRIERDAENLCRDELQDCNAACG